MLNFTGFCTYPLGGYVTFFLIITTAAAVTTTIYSTMSCRFVTVSYYQTINTNDNDNNNNEDTNLNFEEYFQQLYIQQRMNENNNNNNNNNNNTTTSNTAADIVVHHASIGLYQWLRPFAISDDDNNKITDWTVGTCVGYQQTMLSVISDTMFEISRIMSIFAILIGIFQFTWIFFISSCFTMNLYQLYLFVLLCICGIIFTGLTFLFYLSTICTNEFNNTVSCHIDQGGIVMIVSIILWCIIFYISLYYVVPTIRIISTNDSIDFELHKTRTIEEKQKLAIQREIYKQLIQQRQERRERRNARNKLKEMSNISNSSNELPMYISTTTKTIPKQQEQKDTSAIISKQQQHQPDIVEQNNKNGNNDDDNIQIRNSYSFDSKRSWTQPIPKRNQPNINHHHHHHHHYRSNSLQDSPLTTITSTSMKQAIQQQPQRPNSLSRIYETTKKSSLSLLPPIPLIIPKPKTKAPVDNFDNDNNGTVLPTVVSKIIVHPQSTGEIEIMEDGILTPSQQPKQQQVVDVTSTTPTTTPAIQEEQQQQSILLSASPTVTTLPTTIDTTEVRPIQQQQQQEQNQTTKIEQVRNHTTIPTTTTTTKITTNLDAYIAQRLDRIERITNEK